MRRKKSPETVRKVQRLVYVVGGGVLFIGAYNSATSAPASPSWLIAANIGVGMANLFAARFQDRVTILVEAGFEAATGLLAFGSAYATFERGSRHFPLACAWIVPGCLYVGLAVFHLVRKTRQLKAA